MRLISVSFLGILFTLSSYGSVGLPVVNVGRGGVSARAAFGDVASKNNKYVQSVQNVSVAPVREKTETRKVVARSGTKSSKEEIIAKVDFLNPKKPSSNLWASNDEPLRMPLANEFKVISSLESLPEESLESPIKFATLKPVAENNYVRRQEVEAELEKNINIMSNIDKQIAKLTELQKRADESVGVSQKSKRQSSVFLAKQEKNVSEPEKKIARMIVPMEDEDVVVRKVEKRESTHNEKKSIASVREDMTKMSPSQLRAAFRKTFLSENKHLSTMERDDSMDDFDLLSDGSMAVDTIFSGADDGIRPLEIKIKFRENDSALSRDNYNLLQEYAGILIGRPSDSVQISIPQISVNDKDNRKLVARRLAMIEQVLRDNGISESRIMPVLSERNSDGLLLRIISNEQFETLTEQQKNIFGDVVKKKTYKSMSW
ncbi:MAG: hypothetical protein ACLRFI_00125 [Alphaproteobacteria bacterium]